MKKKSKSAPTWLTQNNEHVLLTTYYYGDFNARLVLLWCSSDTGYHETEPLEGSRDDLRAELPDFLQLFSVREWKHSASSIPP